MSSYTDPFRDLERLFERLSEQFERAAGEWDRRDWPEPMSRPRPAGTEIAVDVVERDGEYEVTADLPGFEKDDVTVRVTDSSLRIHAEREAATDERDGDYVRRERRRTTQDRTVPLPGLVDEAGVTARMHNGILTVTLPKDEREQGRQIDIE